MGWTDDGAAQITSKLRFETGTLSGRASG